MNAENDTEIMNIRDNDWTRLVDDVWVFGEGFGRNCNAINAKNDDDRQLNIVNVNPEIGYWRKRNFDT